MLGDIIVITMKDGEKKEIKVLGDIKSVSIENVPSAQAVLELNAKDWPHFVRTLEHQSPITGVGFDPEESQVFISDSSGQIRFWNLESGELEKSWAQQNLNRDLIWLPESNGLVLGTGSHIQQLDMDDNRLIWEIPLSSLRESVLSPDGKLIAMYGSARLRMVDAETGDKITWFNTRKTKLVSPCFSSDSQRLLFVNWRDSQVEIAHPRTGETILELAIQGFKPERTQFLLNDHQVLHVIAIDFRRTYAVWNAETGELIHHRELGRDNWQWSLASMGDTQKVVSLRGDHHDEVVVWNPFTSEESVRFSVPASDRLIVNSNGKYILTLDQEDNGAVRVWDLTD